MARCVPGLEGAMPQAFAVAALPHILFLSTDCQVCVLDMFHPLTAVHSHTVIHMALQRNSPPPRNTHPLNPSACNNGGFGDTFAYPCPHQAMMTDDMRLASDFDVLERHFVYALTGSGTDQECGKCYPVQILDAERVWRDDFPQLIVQVNNNSGSWTAN